MKVLKRLMLAVPLILCLVCVQAQADVTIDLTTVGTSGTINGAVFAQFDPCTATGTGLIESFVRLSTNDPCEHGYNTDGRKLEFDENSSPQFTRALPMSFVPIVKDDFGFGAGEIEYLEFLLDINQSGSGDDILLSLDQLLIAQGTEGDLLGFSSIFASPIYEMDPGTEDNWVKLDYSLNSGSGDGDMLLYVPRDLFGDDPFIYLYSFFGFNLANNDGFEEWAVRTLEPLPVIPAPGAIVLGGIGVCLVGWLRRRRTL